MPRSQRGAPRAGRNTSAYAITIIAWMGNWYRAIAGNLVWYTAQIVTYRMPAAISMSEELSTGFRTRARIAA